MAIATITPTANVSQSRFSDILAGSTDVFKSFVNQAIQQGRDSTSAQLSQENNLIGRIGDIEKEQFALEIDRRNRVERAGEFDRTADQADDRINDQRVRTDELIRSNQAKEEDQDFLNEMREDEFEQDKLESNREFEQDLLEREDAEKAANQKIEDEVVNKAEEARIRKEVSSVQRKIETAETEADKRRIYREEVAKADDFVGPILASQYSRRYGDAPDDSGNTTGTRTSSNGNPDGLTGEQIALARKERDRLLGVQSKLLDKQRDDGELNSADEALLKNTLEELSSIDSVLNPPQADPNAVKAGTDAAQLAIGGNNLGNNLAIQALDFTSDEPAISTGVGIGPSNDKVDNANTLTIDEDDLFDPGNLGKPIPQSGTFSSMIDSAGLVGLDLSPLGITSQGLREVFDEASQEAIDQVSEGDNFFSRSTIGNAQEQARKAVDQIFEDYLRNNLTKDKGGAYNKLSDRAKQKIYYDLKRAFISNALDRVQRFQQGNRRPASTAGNLKKLEEKLSE